MAFLELRWPAAANPICRPRDRQRPQQSHSFAARRFQEFEAALTQPLVIRPEVPGVKKKANPPSGLVANTGLLTFVARNREHQRRACARDGATTTQRFVGRELGVFKNHEAKDVAEKREPIVVARNKQPLRPRDFGAWCALRLIWSSHWAM